MKSGFKARLNVMFTFTKWWHPPAATHAYKKTFTGTGCWFAAFAGSRAASLAWKTPFESTWKFWSQWKDAMRLPPGKQ